jgi:mitogen-activated protein kinase 1/3
VKKVQDVFSDSVLALRTLREMRLLAHFQNEHVLGIKDIFLDGPHFKDVYVCLELMDGDLAQLIRNSRQRLEDITCQSILFQLMCGLLCLHTAFVLHRDLKPSNVLVSTCGIVKLADLGLARSIKACVEQDATCTALTEYVVTRYYRAPEVVLDAAKYTYAVDVWSAGCILGEMLLRCPVFKGKDPTDQIKKIVAAMGGLSHDELSWVPRSSAEFIKMCCLGQTCEGSAHLSHRLDSVHANPAARNLLLEMLRFDPSNRISVEGVLGHDYLAALRGARSADVEAARNVAPVDWSFDLGWSRLCYSSDGLAEQFSKQRCRREIAETCVLLSRRNSLSQTSEWAWSKPETRKVKASIEVGGDVNKTLLSSRTGTGCPCEGEGKYIAGAPIAAVRRKLPFF